MRRIEAVDNLVDGQRILDDLPTNWEIASGGVKDFECVANNIYSDRLFSRFVSSGKMRRLFIGISPEVRDPLVSFQYLYGFGDNWEYLFLQDSQELKYHIESQNSNYIFLPTTIQDRNGGKHVSYSMLNLLAAKRVISQNMDMFPPEAVQQPEGWLTQNQDQWMGPDHNRERDIRYGLLSGFPRDSVIDFSNRVKKENFQQYGSEVNGGYMSSNVEKDS